MLYFNAFYLLVWAQCMDAEIPVARSPGREKKLRYCLIFSGSQNETC
jgi:hypothetical protein